MANYRHNLPDKLIKNVEPVFVTGEEICSVFHESFNWDLTQTWAILTTFRIFILRVLPWKVDIEDFHLKDMNLELKVDKIGPYDTIEFKSKEDILYEMAIYRKKRTEAQRFIHDVSENIRAQVTYGLRPIQKPATTEPLVDQKTANWCTRKLRNLRDMGVITDKELEEELENDPECKDI